MDQIVDERSRLSPGSSLLPSARMMAAELRVVRMLMLGFFHCVTPKQPETHCTIRT